MSNDFFEQRQPKMFQCNFPPGPQPMDLLGLAANGVNGMVDKSTGRQVWNILSAPVRHPSEPGGLFFQASASYPVANLQGTVTLGMVAVPDGAAGVRLVANFIDSMGWDIPTGEMFVDGTMRNVDAFVKGGVGPGTGWYLIQGRWRVAPRFQAQRGAPPQPTVPQHRAVESVEPDPEAVLAPSNCRMFIKALSGINQTDLLNLATLRLRGGWTLEQSYEENVGGVPMIVVEGKNPYSDGKELWLVASVCPHPPGVLLKILLADTAFWTDPDIPSAVMHDAVESIQASLQTRFAGVILDSLGQIPTPKDPITEPAAPPPNVNLVQPFIDQADAANNRGDWNAAIAACADALHVQPNNVNAFKNRGFAYYMQGTHERAIADLTAALDIDNNDAWTWKTRGVAYFDAGRLDQAVKDLTTAMRWQPQDAFAHYKRGLADTDLESFDAAIADYGEAIRLDPTYTLAYANRGYSQMRKHAYDAAIADCSKAVQLDSSYAWAYKIRGMSFHQKGQWNRAIDDYEKCKSLDPNTSVMLEILEFIGMANRRVRFND